MLQIHLLGGFRVIRDGHAVASADWHTRQARQLLKILLTEPNRVVASDRLMELLWPEADETAAMSLRSAINALRAVLEPDRPPHAPSRYIPRGNGGYRIMLPNDDSVWVDTLAFETGLEKAGAGDEAALLLSEALKLYTGDYLPEDEAESWAWPERERLRERFLQGSLSLAELLYERQQYNEALATGRRAIKVAQLSEPLYQLIMRCQAQLGDRAGALLTFERCRQVLDEQLGVSPAPATLQLHTAILQGHLPQARPVAVQTTRYSELAAISFSPLATATLPTVALTNTASPMVGRKTELARLLQQFSQCKAGESRTIALIGEAGVGKSTLVRQFLARLQTASAYTLVVTCQAVEERLAFAPLATMLGNWLREATPATLEQIPRLVLAQLAALVPGLYGRLPNLPGVLSINADQAYTSLMAAVVEFFRHLTQERPLVLVWDDVQWADDSTLRLINRLANLQGVPLLMLIILRAEDLGENTLLTDMVRTLQRHNVLTTLNITRFTTDEVAEYLRLHKLGGRLSASKLHHIVQGNALFLSEAVRVFEDEASTQEEDMTGRIIAGSQQVRDVVLARLDRLPAEAAALLELAAVIGRPFSLDLLSPELSNTDRQALSLLLNRQFLVQVTAPDDLELKLTFAHSLTGQIIYNQISPLKRPQLHQQVADNMARRYAAQLGRHAAEIAGHYRKAGRSRWLQIVHYEVEAGDYARQIANYRQALSHYHSAAEILESPNAALVATKHEYWQGRLYQGLALAYEALLDWPGVQASYRKLWEWAERQGDVRLAGSSALHIIFIRSLMGYLVEAAEIGQSFVEHFEHVVAEENGPAQRSLQIILTGIHHWRRLLTPTRRESFNANPPGKQSRFQAVELKLASDEVLQLLGPVQAAFVLTEYGRALLLYGQLHRAKEFLTAGLKASEETNQIVSWVLATMHLSRLYSAWGEEAKAAELAAAIEKRMASVPEASWLLTWPLLNQAYTLIYNGQLEQAEAVLYHLEAALNTNPHFVTYKQSVQIGWGILEQARGNLTKAAELLQQALAQFPLLYLEAYILAEIALAQISEQQAQIEEALERLRLLLGFCGERGLLELYYKVSLEIQRMQSLAGGPTEPLPWLAEIQELIDQAGFRFP